MAEETKTAKMKFSAIGLEYDLTYIRAVKISGNELGQFNLDAAEELRGAFAQDEDLVEGLLKIKAKLGASGRAQIVSNLTGKQVFATQVPFKIMAAEQMTGALKIHLRKTIPFEIAGSILEYQVIDEPADKTTPGEVVVSVASKVVINRQLRNLEKAGFRTDIVDVLPLAVGNALRVGNSAGDQPQAPTVVIHVGPTVCTVIIDGPATPYLHRNVYFSTEDVYGEKKDKTAPRERERKLNALGQEIARSLSYYEKTYSTGKFDRLFIMGEYVDEASFTEVLASNTGLVVQKLDIASKSQNENTHPPGKFDLAIALALRGVPAGDTKTHTYTCNMVRDTRLAEKKAERARLFTFITGCLSIGVLLLAILFTVLKVLTMESLLSAEAQRLERLEAEYRNYTATRMVVDKADIELLDTLQDNRIFWTKKLAAMALYLPENYWITKFGFKRNELGVEGYGYISKDQEQLVTLDEYLNMLRADSTFKDDFNRTYLDITERADEGNRLRVGFEYSSVNSKTGRIYNGGSR